MKTKFINAFKEAFEIEDRDVQLSDTFREYNEWNSLAQLNMIAMLDEEFEVSIEMDDFKKLITVQDVLDEVTKQSK